MTHAELMQEISAFVACCFYDLHDAPTPIDLEEATLTMENWRQDDVEYPEGMTPEMLVDAWNDAVYNYNKTEEDTPMNIYHVTMDSFGSDCPVNWEEIADYLNKLIDDALDDLGKNAED